MNVGLQIEHHLISPLPCSADPHTKGVVFPVSSSQNGHQDSYSSALTDSPSFKTEQSENAERGTCPSIRNEQKSMKYGDSQLALAVKNPLDSTGASNRTRLPSAPFTALHPLSCMGPVGPGLESLAVPILDHPSTQQGEPGVGPRERQRKKPGKRPEGRAGRPSRAPHGVVSRDNAGGSRGLGGHLPISQP